MSALQKIICRIDCSRKIIFVERHPKDIYRPSCDLLLSSVAESFGKKAIGVILTGMGNDGVAGITRIREAGGWTIAQDEKTSVIFGMPRLAIESNSIDTVLPLEAISSEIVRAAARAGTSARRDRPMPLTPFKSLIREKMRSVV